MMHEGPIDGATHALFLVNNNFAPIKYKLSTAVDIEV